MQHKYKNSLANKNYFRFVDCFAKKGRGMSFSQLCGQKKFLCKALPRIKTLYNILQKKTPTISEYNKMFHTAKTDSLI